MSRNKNGYDLYQKVIPHISELHKCHSIDTEYPTKWPEYYFSQKDEVQVARINIKEPLFITSNVELDKNNHVLNVDEDSCRLYGHTKDVFSVSLTGIEKDNDWYQNRGLISPQLVSDWLDVYRKNKKQLSFFRTKKVVWKLENSDEEKIKQCQLRIERFSQDVDKCQDIEKSLSEILPARLVSRYRDSIKKVFQGDETSLFDHNPVYLCSTKSQNIEYFINEYDFSKEKYDCILKITNGTITLYDNLKMVGVGENKTLREDKFWQYYSFMKINSFDKDTSNNRRHLMIFSRGDESIVDSNSEIYILPIKSDTVEFSLRPSNYIDGEYWVKLPKGSKRRKLRNKNIVYKLNRLFNIKIKLKIIYNKLKMIKRKVNSNSYMKIS